MLLLPSFTTDVQAEAKNIFVSPGGTGADPCPQSDPCDLATGLGIAEDGDKLYFRYGTYTGGTDPIMTIEEGISMYGGWDGTSAFPVILDPENFETIIDGKNSRKLLRIDYSSSNSSVSVQGITFQNGSSFKGGAIEVNHGSVVIEGDKFEENFASFRGGAIYIASGAEVLISSNIFVNNVSEYDGGGIYLNDPELIGALVTIKNNHFEANTVKSYGYGGAVAVEQLSILEIKGNDFVDNDGKSGGGAVYILSGFSSPQMTIEGNRFSGNKIGKYYSGSAIRVQDPSVRITRNLFTDHITEGTAVIEIGSSITQPSEISNNVIIRSEMAIRFYGATISQSHRVWNNTIVYTEGSAITVSAATTPVNIANNIIMDANESIHADESAWVTGSNNLFFNNGSNPFLLASVEEDPKFVLPGSDDFHLQKESPAVDAGATIETLTDDFDGDIRPSGAGFDIGADEVMRDHFIFLPLIIK